MDKIISNEARTILEHLYNNEHFVVADYSDSAFDQLKSYGLISHDIIAHKDPIPGSEDLGPIPIYATSITEDGKAYLEALLREEADRAHQFDTLQGIVDSLQQRVKVAEDDLELAKEQSAQAEKAARRAALRSWIAIIISIAAVAATIIAALIDAKVIW